MRSKKSIIILLLIIVLMITGCSNTTKSTKEESVKQKEISGIYFNENDNTEFIEFKKDGTFNKQSNFCEGISHVDGKYVVTNYKGESAIKVKYTLVGETTKRTEYWKYTNNIITKFKTKNDNEYNISIIDGCSGTGIYKKGTEDDIERMEDFSSSTLTKNYSTLYTYQDYITNVAPKTEYSYTLKSYALVDIDKDKIPELLLSYEDDSYRGNLKFYKYSDSDSEVIYLGESELNNSGFSNSKKKYLLKEHNRQGGYSYSTIEIKKNKIKEKLIEMYAEFKDNGAGYDAYLERLEKFYKDYGASEINFYDIDDITGFSNYSN